MIVLLLSYSVNSLQVQAQTNKPIAPSTGKQLQSDTGKVSVPISYIKDANAKLIERVYLLEVNKQQDSIINLNKLYIDEQSFIIKDFQGKVITLTNNVNTLNKSVASYKQHNAILKGISIVGIAGVILAFILK